MEKINRNTFNRYIHILFPENTWNVNGRIKLGKCFTEKLKMDDQLCLGKAVFKNYLGKKGFVYMVKIYNAETIDQIELQEIVCDSVFIIPVEDKQLLEKEAKVSKFFFRILITFLNFSVYLGRNTGLNHNVKPYK